MATRSRGKRSDVSFDLQKLINHVRDADESWQIIQTWQAVSGDDRSQAIVAGALREQALESALSTHFVTSAEETRALFIDHADGGISSFAVKIKLAFALGMIEKTIRAELIMIKNIRNVFAHTRAAVTFTDPRISAACNRLKIPEMLTYGGILGLPPIHAKDRIAMYVKMIYLYFIGSEVSGPLKHANNEYYCHVLLREPTLDERNKGASPTRGESNPDLS
jgi:DNA-binding MltR family transcriptional regulator